MKQKNLNIWIINQYAGSPLHGMNFRSYYLGKELLKDDYEVTIFSGSFSHLFSSPPQVSSMFTKELIDGMNYIWIKLPHYGTSKSFKRLFSMLVFSFKLLFFNPFSLKKPDVIIISSLSLFPILNAYLWSKILKTKLIFEVRDIWPLTLVELGNVSPYNPLVLFLSLLEKFGYKKADYVVSLLPKAKEHMITRGLSAHKFRYIPNGINLEELQNPQPLQKEVIRQIPRDKFIVGYAGTLGIANALEYFLDAAHLLQKHSNIHFVLVGNGSEKEHLITYAKKYNLKNITFIEAIAKKQIQTMLQYFTICYIGWHHYPLYRFGISANKLYDYMYAQKPIIHSVDAGNNPVEEAECGITVAPEAPQEIADAVMKLYHLTQKERDVLGSKAKAYVLQYHSYAALADKYKKLFN
jgi:glycosyltransferase involved in cell wall biosynthesis